jgi:lysophospholipase L1-like esterase
MRKFFIRLLVIAMSVLFSLAAAEIAVRLLWSRLQGPIMPMSLKTHRVSVDKDLGYELIPGSSVFQDDAWYRINDSGMRDRDFARDKKAGVYRIAAVGDSFTFGMGVAAGDTWPKQLERRLDREGARTEVLNFGVMGYDTEQEAEQVRAKVLPFHPDLIIIEFTLNDIGILSRERRELKQYQGYHRFLATGNAFVDRLLHASRLYLLFKNRLYIKKTRADALPPQYSADGFKVIQLGGLHNFIKYAYTQKESLDRLARALEKVRAVVANRIPVLVAIYPDLSDFGEYPYRAEHGIVRELSVGKGFMVVDPLTRFLGHDPADLRISAANPHPNRRGNDLFAAAIEDFLRDTKLYR